MKKFISSSLLLAVCATPALAGPCPTSGIDVWNPYEESVSHYLSVSSKQFQKCFRIKSSALPERILKKVGEDGNRLAYYSCSGNSSQLYPVAIAYNDLVVNSVTYIVDKTQNVYETRYADSNSWQEKLTCDSPKGDRIQRNYSTQRNQQLKRYPNVKVAWRRIETEVLPYDAPAPAPTFWWCQVLETILN